MRNSRRLVGVKHLYHIPSTARSCNTKLYNHGGTLHQMLEELTTLNEGKCVNPRSPKQVSELLYKHNGSSLRNSGTDKNTLLSIINRETDDTEINRQRRIAQLILACREMMSSSSTYSWDGKRLPIQSASFSSLASSDDDKGETEDDIIRKINMNQSEPTTLHVHQTNNIDLSADEDNLFSPSVDSTMSPYEQLIQGLFRADETDECSSITTPKGQTTKIDSYWEEPLRSLAKPSARNLVQQLHPHCPMGYDPNATPVSHLTSSNNTTTKKETPLLSFVRTQKREHFSDAILLVRVGDFYESHGIDAIMLVEHAGLNPMANKARAGCPKGNIQATLDALVGSGFRVAVYEEAEDGEIFLDEEDTGSSSGTKGKLKTRYLSQVVSSANPTYMHNMVLNDNDGSALDDSSSHGDDGSSSGIGRSYVGVIETLAGYTLVEISAEERTAVVSERLTAEALSCRLIAYPPADPLFYVPHEASSRRTDRLPFLPWRQNQHSSVDVSPVSRVRVKTIPPELAVDRHGLTDLERAKQTIILAFLRLEDDSITKSIKTDKVGGATPPKRRERRQVTHNDFVLITPSSGNDSDKTNPFPLHLETAMQLGLMKDPSIPSLVASLLPESAPSSCRRFLRRWLLVRPSPDVADSMAILVRALKDEDRSLPNAAPLTSKVIPMIRAGQASASVYRNILYTLDSAIQLLDQGSSDDYTDIIPSLKKILYHDTGIDIIDTATLRESFVVTKELIKEVVDTHDDEDNQDEISYYGDLIPSPFLERNELTWRSRVKKSALRDTHLKVGDLSKNLAEAIATDFWGMDSVQFDEYGEINLSASKEAKSPIVQDIFNNIIAIKKIPAWNRESKYYHPRDRNGKVLANRYTTERVENALSAYIEACENAKLEVVKALRRLSFTIVDNEHLSSILQASHLNLITSTAVNHAACSNQKGWNVAQTYDHCDKSDSAGFMNGVWPYWMSKSDSTANTFDMNGMFLLTAPNMSGKSTVMRSTAAAALLITSGLCAPVLKGSAIRRFDSLFVRGASADIPTENKSAFGAEMGDVSSLLRTCGSQSLVFVDEIGRGTSPRDGTSLAGAILERMAETGMSGMFATHLHGILDFPLSDAANQRLRMKRMAVRKNERGELDWTYCIEDGVCTDSVSVCRHYIFLYQY